MIVLIFATSVLHVTTEHWWIVGRLAGMLHGLFQIFGLFAVPAIVFGAVVRRAELRFGATRRDIDLVFLVAAILYCVHLPLILFLFLITGMTRWPWR
jgi:hypothetical protein